MTEYRIFRPHDGRIPFKEEPVNLEMEAVEPDSITIIDE
jgi:hypothetical protein